MPLDVPKFWGIFPKFPIFLPRGVPSGRLHQSDHHVPIPVPKIVHFRVGAGVARDRPGRRLLGLQHLQRAREVGKFPKFPKFPEFPAFPGIPGVWRKKKSRNCKGMGKKWGKNLGKKGKTRGRWEKNGENREKWKKLGMGKNEEKMEKLGENGGKTGKIRKKREKLEKKLGKNWGKIVKYLGKNGEKMEKNREKPGKNGNTLKWENEEKLWETWE